MRFQFRHLFTPYYHAQISSVDLRLLFNNDVFTEGDNNAFHELKSKLLVGIFTAAIHQLYPNLVAVIQKVSDFLELDIEVVLANFEAEAYLLEFTHLGMLAVPLLLFHLLILVFTPVDDFGNRRRCLWGDLNQIEPSVFGGLQCISS